HHGNTLDFQGSIAHLTPAALLVELDAVGLEFPGGVVGFAGGVGRAVENQYLVAGIVDAAGAAVDVALVHDVLGVPHVELVLVQIDQGALAPDQQSLVADDHIAFQFALAGRAIQADLVTAQFAGAAPDDDVTFQYQAAV